MQRFKVKEGAVTFFKPGIIAESAMNLSAISCLLFLSDIMWSRVGVSQELLPLFAPVCTCVSFATQYKVGFGCSSLKKEMSPPISYKSKISNLGYAWHDNIIKCQITITRSDNQSSMIVDTQRKRYLSFFLGEQVSRPVIFIK